MRTIAPPWQALRCARRTLPFAAALLVSACAHMHVPWPTAPAVEFWAAAVTASSSERDRMWKHAQQEGLSWRLAMLQSLPDYHRYDPSGARKRLKAVLADYPPRDVRMLTEIRIAELEAGRACRAEVENLRQRLTDVIAIERKLDNDGR